MIIDEIIPLLSTDQGSVTEALLKTKILLHQIGHRELVEWVNHELGGYTDPKDVPPYRLLRARVLGNISNTAWHTSVHPIPIRHLTKEQRERLEIIPMLDSISIVSQLAASPDGSLRRPLAMEFNYHLGKSLNKNYHIDQAWCAVSTIDIQNITFQVKSRLLDFMLELKRSIGDVSNEADLKEKISKMDTPSMFNNTIFGNQTTIIVGDRNVQTVTIKDNAEIVENLMTLYLSINDHPEDEKIKTDMVELVEIATQGDVTKAKSIFEKIFGFATETVKNTALGILATAIAKALGVG